MKPGQESCIVGCSRGARQGADGGAGRASTPRSDWDSEASSLATCLHPAAGLPRPEGAAGGHTAPRFSAARLVPAPGVRNETRSITWFHIPAPRKSQRSFKLIDFHIISRNIS